MDFDHARNAEATAERPAASAEPDTAPTERLALPVPGLAADYRVQRRVVVGHAGDPAEVEAEQVARSVVAALRRKRLPGGPDEASRQEPAGLGLAAIRRHASHSHEESDAGEQPAIGLEGGELDRGIESSLGSSRGGGTRLPDTLRTELEAAMGVDLSAIRLHAGAEAARLNRVMSASAFTYGRDVYFRDGIPDAGSESGLQLLAHELTHTVQQGVAPVRRRSDAGGEHAHAADGLALATPIEVHRSASDPTVHRHSAFEHYLLGQLPPSELAKIPAVRDIEDNKKQRDNVDKGLDGGLVVDDDPQVAKRDEVKHIIDQEMNRLLAYRKNPDALAHRIGELGVVGKDPQDDEWQVPIVVLTCGEGTEKVVVTYSEMNTLPDLFGSPDAILQTPKDKVLGILQGVRQQLYIELSNIRKELFGSAQNVLHNRIKVDGDFEGARGPRAQAVVESVYSIRTESEVNADTTRAGAEHEQYFAALERNACHFAPESWVQWRGYHEKALAIARESHVERVVADIVREGDAEIAKMHEEKAANLANDALIQNSFGEHYLQDSFAAGHLIDKTKIMQWFVLWLDRNDKDLGSTPHAKAQWAMTVHAAQSDLKSNPQALHDKGVADELGGASGAAAEIGMDATPEIELMMHWRVLAKNDATMRSISIDDAAENFKLGPEVAEARLTLLVAKSFAKKEKDGRFTLDKEMIDVFNTAHDKTKKGAVKAFFSKQNAYTATKGDSPDGTITDDQATEAAAEFNLASYNVFLSNAYIQKATQFFHDRFCEEGLEVRSGTGFDLGRIYGDQNMLNAGGQVGLEYAAETSKMSREALFETLTEGKPTYTTDQIAARFATQVKVDGEFIDIDKFNLGLQAAGEKGLFKKARGSGALIAYKAKDGISSKGALNVAQLASHGEF